MAMALQRLHPATPLDRPLNQTLTGSNGNTQRSPCLLPGLMSDKCGVLLGIRKLATLTLAAAASCTSNFHEFFLPFVKVRSTKIQHSSRPALGSNNTAGHFISPGCFPPAPSTAISIIYTRSWTWQSANTCRASCCTCGSTAVTALSMKQKNSCKPYNNGWQQYI